MKRPSLKFIVHRYYAMMYLMALLIILGVCPSKRPTRRHLS